MVHRITLGKSKHGKIFPFTHTIIAKHFKTTLNQYRMIIILLTDLSTVVVTELELYN